MRDSQKSRVYASDEWEGDAGVELHSKLWQRHVGSTDGDVWRKSIHVDKVQAYTDAVLLLNSVQSRFGRHNIKVRPGRGSATGGYGRVKLPRWARTEHTVLHEIAHCLAPAGAWHGPEYAGTLITLVRCVVGATAARSMKAAMRKHRVRISMKHIEVDKSRVVTRAQRIERKRARAAEPVSSVSVGSAAAVIRKMAAFGYFGATGRKPRAHAMEVARTLDKLAHSGRGMFGEVPNGN